MHRLCSYNYDLRLMCPMDITFQSRKHIIMKVFTYFTCGCGENNRFCYGTYITVLFHWRKFYYAISLSSVNDYIKNNYYAW